MNLGCYTWFGYSSKLVLSSLGHIATFSPHFLSIWSLTITHYFLPYTNCISWLYKISRAHVNRIFSLWPLFISSELPLYDVKYFSRTIFRLRGELELRVWTDVNKNPSWPRRQNSLTLLNVITVTPAWTYMIQRRIPSLQLKIYLRTLDVAETKSGQKFSRSFPKLQVFSWPKMSDELTLLLHRLQHEFNR